MFKSPAPVICAVLCVAVEVCQSFAVDNGAFSAWKKGEPVQDWRGYYAWAAACKLAPARDFAVVPDVIDGGEDDNDALLIARHAGLRSMDVSQRRNGEGQTARVD